jgi:hypothetical protein
MLAFLAASDGDLLTRARLWNAVVELIKDSGNLAGGSKDEQTENKGSGT